MAGLFGFVTPETLYSVPERKANKKCYYLNQETKFIIVCLKKKIGHFSGLKCLYNIKETGKWEILNHVENCCSRIYYGNPSKWTKKEKFLAKGSWFFEQMLW